MNQEDYNNIMEEIEEYKNTTKQTTANTKVRNIEEIVDRIARHDRNLTTKEQQKQICPHCGEKKEKDMGVCQTCWEEHDQETLHEKYW